MKTLKKPLQPVTLLLTVVMLLQSCTVYKSTPITMERAVETKSKVKIVTNKNEKINLIKMEFEEGNYYGIKRVRGKMVNVPLDEKSISSVKEKDQVSSIFLTLTIPLALVVGFIGSIYIFW